MAETEKYLGELRTLCLSLPETTETESHGHPNFRAGRLTFVTWEWHKGRPSIAFRLDPPDQEVIKMLADCFYTPYGRGKWVSLWADVDLDWPIIEDLVMKSYRTVALKRMLNLLDENSE